MEKKCDLSNCEHRCRCETGMQKNDDLQAFSAQPSLEFTGNSVSSLGENASVMSEVRGAWLHCFELTGR